SGWQLALMLHPEMKKRVGAPLVERPPRRFEAIAAVERELAAKPDDAAAWDLKRLLYAPLNESMYLQQTAEGVIREEFDYGYINKFGMALIDEHKQCTRGD